MGWVIGCTVLRRVLQVRVEPSATLMGRACSSGWEVAKWSRLLR